MKLMKRTNIYAASNVTFNPETKAAYSYSWWQFVKVIDGLVIFNNYRYSPTTGKHQHKVRSLLNSLNIKIDLEMPIPKGLQQDCTIAEFIESAEEFLCDKCLKDELKKQERYLAKKAAKAALFDQQLDSCVAEILEKKQTLSLVV